MRIVLVIVFTSFIALSSLTLVCQAIDVSGTESLNSKLLEDLAPSTPANKFPGAQPPASLIPHSGPFAPQQPANSTLVPLAGVQQGMQRAQSLLAKSGTQPATIKEAGTVQQKVVSDLDKLIADLSKQCQCQGGQCNKPPKPGEGSKPKPGKPSSTAATAKAPARDSSDRLDRTSAKPVDKGDVNDMVKELWGHLPQRSREQMLQSFSDEFLPKYELEIEQYYRKLSEKQEKAGDSAPPTN